MEYEQGLRVEDQELITRIQMTRMLIKKEKEKERKRRNEK
jgi:hypothetical protein